MNKNYMIKNLTISHQLNLLVLSVLMGFMLASMGLVYYQIDQIFQRQRDHIVAQKKNEIVEKTKFIHQIAAEFYQANSTIQAIEREYKNKLVVVIDAAISSLQTCYDKFKQANLSDEAIQMELRSLLKGIRYDEGTGYVFAYDFKGTVISHIDDQFEGKRLYPLQDLKGKQFLQESIILAQKQGQGFVNYYWNKPGYQEPELKLSYVKVFQPYQWILATGIYVADTREVLKQKIIRLITWHRYDLGNTRNNYFFILTTEGETVANPGFPNLNGTNVRRFKDPSGKLFVEDFIATAKTQGSGFIDYIWPKPNQGELGKKLTYVQLFKPFNWIIATGLYFDDIGIHETEEFLRQEAQSQIRLILIMGTVFLIFGSLASHFFMRMIVHSLRQTKEFAQSIARGHFSEVILRHHSSKDEIGQLISALNSMGQQLQESFSTLHMQNEQLLKLNQEKNDLLGIVAHDLKNPLAGILGMANLIKDTLAKEEIIEYATLITTASEQMFDLITNLLDVNAIESGKMKIHLAKIDLLPIIHLVMKRHQEWTKAKSITIHFHSLATYSLAWVDEKTVAQVLDNLISNAIKYSYREKSIDIRLSQHEQSLRCEIQDQGPGLSEADQQKLFGKFTRLTPQPTNGEHSTGLGLFIVKKLVEVMHGKIWCLSELGQGSTFIIEFPMAT